MTIVKVGSALWGAAAELLDGGLRALLRDLEFQGR